MQTFARRLYVSALIAVVVACAGGERSDPIVGRWRDVRYQSTYEFLPDGRARFELHSASDQDPALSAVLLPEVSWRPVSAGYEITQRTPGIHGGSLTVRGVGRLDGDQIVTNIPQAGGMLTLERLP